MVIKSTDVTILSRRRVGGTGVLEGDGAHIPQIDRSTRARGQNESIFECVVLDACHPVLMLAVGGDGRLGVARVPEADTAIVSSSDEVVRVVGVDINVADADLVCVRDVEDLPLGFRSPRGEMEDLGCR